MKKFVAWLMALMIFLTLPVTALAEDNERYINNWIVAKYEVSRDVIYPGDIVDVQVWLYNAVEIEDISNLKVAPETASFNDVQRVKIEEDNYDGAYLPVIFEDARYMGEGNTFMMRVDGEVLSLTIHECVPSSELEQEHSDQTTPVLQVGRYDQPKPIAKGESQTVTVWVNNIADHDLVDVVATVTPSSELMVADNSVSYPIGRIWEGDVAFFDVTLQAYGELSSAAQSLTVDVAYTYDKDGAWVQGSASHTVPLAATASQQTEGMTASVPNIIVSGYDYGGSKISAGTAFDLDLEFKNTSSARQVENIVMTIDPGTALAITSSSNSFHFPVLGVGQTQSQTINLQALPDAPSAPAVVTVKFSYEYVDNNTRQTVTTEQTVSLPVYQLDRFELSQDMTFVDAWQFQESFLTLNYINKGKSTVYNVSAELQGDISAMSKVQHIGNVEAGRSGTIDFIITPELAGETQCTVAVTYEDDAMQPVTKEFTFDILVNEMYVPEVMPEEIVMEEEPSGGVGWVLPVVIVVLAAGAIVLILVLRKRKKKQSGVVDSFVFTDGTEDTNEIS